MTIERRATPVDLWLQSVEIRLRLAIADGGLSSAISRDPELVDTLMDVIEHVTYNNTPTHLFTQAGRVSEEYRDEIIDDYNTALEEAMKKPENRKVGTDVVAVENAVAISLLPDVARQWALKEIGDDPHAAKIADICSNLVSEGGRKPASEIGRPVAKKTVVAKLKPNIL